MSAGTEPAELADRTRELLEAVVRTGAGPERLARAAELVAEATRLIREPLRDPSPPPGRTWPYNPVTGRANPYAPPLRARVGDDGSVTGTVTLTAVHEGPPGHAHGGIVALLLDQVLGHAVAASGPPGMTVSLTVHYRRPTPLGVPLVIDGRRSGGTGRRVFAAGAVRADGVVTAEATGVFVAAPAPLSRLAAHTAGTA